MKLTLDTCDNEKQLACAHTWRENDQVTDIVYGGAKGGAKSYTGAALILMDAFFYPQTHYFIARDSLTDLRKFTIPTIFEVLKNFGISHKSVNYNGQDNFFRLNNGSKIFLIDAKYLPSDPLYQRFGSMQMTRGWIEEAGEFKEAAKNNLAASIGRWKNDVYRIPGKLLQTCNPAKNYLYTDYYKKWKEGRLEPYKAFIQAFPQDNKKLPGGYIENLQRILAKNEKERLLNGNWEYDDDPSVLMEFDKILEVFKNEVPTGKKFITVDVARLGGDKIVLIEWNGWNGKVRWFQKQTLDKTVEIIEEARIRMGISPKEVIADEDGLGGGVVDFGKYKGFVNNSSALPSPTAVYQDGKKPKENYDNLKSQCYFRLSERVNKNEIFLQCGDVEKEWIIEELEQVKQKSLDSDLKKGVIPKDKVKEMIGRSPDFADAIMMREYFELKPPKQIVAAIY
jgi:hypothetical protein